MEKCGTAANLGAGAVEKGSVCMSVLTELTTPPPSDRNQHPRDRSVALTLAELFFPSPMGRVCLFAFLGIIGEKKDTRELPPPPLTGSHLDQTCHVFLGRAATGGQESFF